MTTTIKIAANGKMALPNAVCKAKRLKAGTALRGASILLTPVYPPTEEELMAVIDEAGGPGPSETPKTRKQAEAAIERVRGRARKVPGRH